MIRERDGIHFDLERKIVADSRSAAGDVNFVSHAHMDHVHRGDGDVLCSEVTSKLASTRIGKELDHSDSNPDIQLMPSGHIIGSRAALIDDKILYTGDVSTRDRFYLDGFKPVDAETLVVETTYGVPVYTFPGQQELEARIKDWIEGSEGPLFLFAYSLGKAQKVQHLVQRAVERPMMAHGSVIEMNQVIEENTDLDFQAEPFESGDITRETVVVAPPGSRKSLGTVIRKNSGVTAGFSGWAVNNSMGYSRYDRSFPLSDHCDFRELVELVKEVDPEKVYTHHGFDEAFAAYLRSELGYNARALKRNQASLDEF